MSVEAAADTAKFLECTLVVRCKLSHNLPYAYSIKADEKTWQEQSREEYTRANGSENPKQDTLPPAEH